MLRNRDLDEAVSYLVRELSAPSAARSLLDAYEDKLQLIADNPLLFDFDLEVSEAVGKKIRKCQVKHYGTYYLVDEKANLAQVVAFIHGLRDSLTIRRGRQQ
ncbi:type II toxin-antitoxin system RelE/ParE family toxin [Olsenella sp. Marseille-P4559]|uniref:type II toxin-antitoxin system RelE/ParE family toxin n=1 Tax=Olsenella sp. Marseille-P4559 TaxID=2364795 RepID=UPI0010319B9C